MKNIERLPFPHLIKELVDYNPNIMNPRQVYRKHSSEWMGFKIEFIKGKRYYVKDNFHVRIQAWQPDISYDQMHMMIKKLQEDEVCVYLFHEEDGDCWVRITQLDKETIEYLHKDIRTAFRLACTEYQTAK